MGPGGAEAGAVPGAVWEDDELVHARDAARHSAAARRDRLRVPAARGAGKFQLVDVVCEASVICLCVRSHEV